MEESDELRGEIRGQARAVSRGDRDGQDLGDVERGGAPRPVGDSKSDPQRRLQDQENLQKAGKDGGRGRLHCLTVLVRHENVIRLLEFLGYRQEEGVVRAPTDGFSRKRHRFSGKELGPRRRHHGAEKAAVSSSSLGLLHTSNTPTRFFGLAMIGHGSGWCGEELCFPRKV